jgi:DNA invertase Pin-like site-specific DNA recombinase
MPLYGYARVSTFDQDLSIQRDALKAAGCEVIRAEKASGARRGGRTELQVLLDFLRVGDTLVVTRIDRLARSLKDLQDVMYELKAGGDRPPPWYRTSERLSPARQADRQQREWG